MNIAQTPAVPYAHILEDMSRKEKIAVVTFLVDSLPGIEIVEKGDDAMSSDDEAFLARQLEKMNFSPRIERLFDKRREAAQAVDMKDERTRHLLGL